jgi:hypothetical protein
MIVTGVRRWVVLGPMEKEIEREADQPEPEDQPGEGAEGGRQSSDADAPPAAPSKDSDSALGDTDQHSES